MGKIITIKNNKGGVGKSWITLQLAHGLTMLEKNNGENYKVLILTSDSQNNVLLYSGYTEKVKEGLEEFVLKNEETQIRLRDNLFYIPLLSNNFSKHFRDKLKIKIDEIKNDYDFILIDSVPVLNIDSDFIEVSDSIIIPSSLDSASVQGIIKLMDEIDMKKIKVIIPNLYSNTKSCNSWLSALQDATRKTTIHLSSPIKRLQILIDLSEAGKTIWEKRTNSIAETQIVFYNIIQELLNEKE